MSKNSGNQSVSISGNQKNIYELFEKYSIELEKEYDLYENLVKKGREITYESKKIIFLLHRVENKAEGKKYLYEAKGRLRKVYLQITEDIGSMLRPEEVHKYIRAFRPGIQEFVEATSFYYYLMFGTLMSLAEMYEGAFILDDYKEQKCEDKLKGLNMSDMLTLSDYVLGILDLTGELMRKCICSKNPEEPFLLRDILHGIVLALNNAKMNRDLKRKYLTLKDNLLKVEKVCYSVKVRTVEIERIVATKQIPSNLKDYQQKIIESAFISEPESSFGHEGFFYVNI